MSSFFLALLIIFLGVVFFLILPFLRFFSGPSSLSPSPSYVRQELKKALAQVEKTQAKFDALLAEWKKS